MSELDDMLEDETRADVVAAARDWIGTPFHHGAEIKGVGVDCGHLIAAVYCGLGLVERPDVEQYSPDWFLHSDVDHLGAWIRRYADQVELPGLGDVALYRYGRSASHAAIVVRLEPLFVVHAFRQRGVVEDEAGPGSALAVRSAGYWSWRTYEART